MKKHLDKLKVFSCTLAGKTAIAGIIIGLIIGGLGPVWKASADAPADTSGYAIFSVNGNTSLTNVDNANSVTAGYEHGSLTFGGSGLFSDGTNNVYVPNGTNVTIDLTADTNYDGTIWVNGVDTNGSTAPFENVNSNDGITNIDAVFQGISNAQATFDYTYSGENFAGIYINGTDLQTPDRQYTNNHINFQSSYSIAPGDTTVSFVFETLWVEVMDSLTINNVDYSNQLPKTKDELAHAYNGAQAIAFEIQNVPIASTYTISTNTNWITAEQQFMGNFLWDNDTSKLNDPNLSDEEKDDIIGHGTLEFVKAEYNGATYETVNDLNAAGNLFYFENNNNEQSTDGADRKSVV